MDVTARSQRNASARRPILYLVGALMAGIVLLAIGAMLSSMVIAQVNQGMAAAVNQSGSLRMQSYRVGMALADQSTTSAEHNRRARALAAELAQRLASPRLLDAIPAATDDPVRVAYERVMVQWERVMLPAVDEALTDPDSIGYRQRVDGFVDEIHTLVRALEERAEHRIDLLRLMQGVALLLTVIAVLVTMWLLKQRVVTPLDDLLHCADRARQGDFSVRTRFVGPDELGRLGAAMNLMTQGLWHIYNELEERVAEKTRDLARSNRSLDLLYRSSRRLDGSAVSDSALRAVLADVKGELKLQTVMLCLRGGWDDGAPGTGPEVVAGCVGADDPALGGAGHCIDPSCRLGALSSRPSQSPPESSRLEQVAEAGDSDAIRPIRVGLVETGEACPSSAVTFPVADQGRRYGTLRVVPAGDDGLEAWQVPLLEAVASQLANVLNLQGRLRESRRLLLHEERSILARELHDSLAQSLSYLKIQAARLDAALNGKVQQGSSSPHAIVSEMREGISSAYRQLRELLTTFRLRIGGEGLSAALAETVDDFRRRAGLEIALDDRLPEGLLSPNEEVHVLQIVREALSNSVRHAQAAHLRLMLEAHRHTGEIVVEVADDGIGLGAPPVRRGHYGLTIMRERAASLGGSLDVGPAAPRGTSVRLRFRSRRSEMDAPPLDAAPILLPERQGAPRSRP
jgi:two-component system nitrate/nitrite sensor histidine kinase NarX